MWDEDKYFQELARRLLDAYTIEDILDISETDPVDLLAELIRTNQITINVEDFELDDKE